MGGRGLVAASMDGGGSRPTFEALEKLASAVEPSSSSEWGVKRSKSGSDPGRGPHVVTQGRCQVILTSVSVIVSSALPADPVEALRELARGEVELDRLRRDRVRLARESGASWEQIGAALGMSRQSAWEYFTRDVSDGISANAGGNVALGEDEATELAVAEVRAVRRRRARH